MLALAPHGCFTYKQIVLRKDVSAHLHTMKSTQYTAGQVRGTGRATQRGKATYKHQAASLTPSNTSKPCALVSSSSIVPMPCKLTHKEWVALLEGPVMLHILLYSLKEAEKTAIQLKTIEGPWDLSHLKTHMDDNTTSNTNTTKAIITNTPTKTSTKASNINTPTTVNTPTKASTKTALPDQLAATPESHKDSSIQAQALSCIDGQAVSCKVNARCIITSTMRPSDDTASATDSTPCEDTTPPLTKATSQEQHCRTAWNMQQQQPPSYGFGAWAGRLNESLRSVGRFVSRGFAAWHCQAVSDSLCAV